MREILFRGKRIDDNVNDKKSIDYVEKSAREWVYGDIIHRRYYKNKDVVIIRADDSGFDNYSDYEVDPSTIEQYTGLTDKNGKKIFEGDIIKGKFSNYAIWADEAERAFVYGKSYKGGYKNLMSDYLLKSSFPNGIEIIGNIHDNPELLEVTK